MPKQGFSVFKTGTPEGRWQLGAVIASERALGEDQSLKEVGGSLTKNICIFRSSLWCRMFCPGLLAEGAMPEVDPAWLPSWAEGWWERVFWHRLELGD